MEPLFNNWSVMVIFITHNCAVAISSAADQLHRPTHGAPIDSSFGQGFTGFSLDGTGFFFIQVAY